jgi:aminoglycoside 3-N-acetyltransferase
MGSMTRAVALPTLDRTAITAALARLGSAAPSVVLVHCGLRAVGRVLGGPATVLGAIGDALGPQATIVVPTQTPNNSTTSDVYRSATRGMTARQRLAYEARIEGFDRDRTPSYGMGALAEHVRRHPRAVRSAHPQTSFAAVGPRAAELMAVHDLECHLGERSPLGALYAADASTLLLGVGYSSCTALHLAEYRLLRPPVRRYRCFVDVHGHRERRDFDAVDLNAGDFNDIGRDLDREPFVRSAQVGSAVARLIPVRKAVDFAIGWMATRRRP